MIKSDFHLMLFLSQESVTLHSLAWWLSLTAEKQKFLLSRILRKTLKNWNIALKILPNSQEKTFSMLSFFKEATTGGVL